MYLYEKSSSKRNIRPRTLYYFATFIITTKLILAFSELIVIGFVNDFLNYAFILLMALKVFFDFGRKINKVYVFFILFSLLALYTSVKTDNYFVLMSALGIIALKQMNIRSIIRIMFETKVFWLAIHFFCYMVALLICPGSITYSVINGVIRHRIFLSQPNTCAMLFLWAIFEYMYLNYEKLSFYKFIKCTIIFSIVLLMTKSRTSAIVYFAVWLIIWMSDKKVTKKLINIFSKYGYIILSVFFISMILLYTVSPLAWTLNTMLTGRLAGGAKAYELYGFTMMGQYIELGKSIEWDPFYGVDQIWLENSYTMIFINIGIIYGIIIAAVLWHVSQYLTERDKVFVCAMLLYGINESYIINIFLCFPLLVVAEAIFNKNDYVDRNHIEYTLKEQVRRRYC